MIGNSSNKSVYKKCFSDDINGKSSKSLLNESKITKNHSINGTENEKTSSDKSLIKKKLSPKKLKVNDSNSPNNKQLKKKANKRNNGFEIDI